MNVKIFLFVVALVTASVGFAQKAKITFHPSVQAGLLEGERGGALQLQTVQSIGYKTWSFGLGAGLDYYHTRSIPLFADVRKALSKKEQRPFVYVDGGYHFPWLTTADKEALITEAKGGLYYDAGIGYEFPVMKKNRFFFSAGFGYKAYKGIHRYTICPFMGPCFVQTEVLDYQLRRLSIKTGLCF